MVDAFIIHPTYTTISDNYKKSALVTLWVKLEDGRSALIKKKAYPYFFIHTKNVEKAKKLSVQQTVRFEKVNLKSMKERENVTKVLVDIPATVPVLREIFEKADIACLEADVPFAYRAMMDEGIHGTCSLTGQERAPTNHEHVDVVFEESDIQVAQHDYVPVLSLLSFDIESDKESGTIYCLSSTGVSQGKERTEKMIVSNTPVAGARHFSTEKELLEAFRDLILEWDPDVITGWNVIDFDLQLLHTRAQFHSVPFAIGRDGSALKLRLESSFFRDSKATVTGRVVLDGIQILKNNFIKLPDYKLATAAREFTDAKKLIETTGQEKYEEITRLYHEDKEALLKYNLEDARLVLEILEKSGALKLTIKRSLLVGMPLDRVSASIASLDNLYFRELHAKGFVAPSVIPRRRDSEGIGGFVMKSKPGIYDFVIVCDFKSLYPSIMRTFNIDPLMYVSEADAKDFTKGELIHAPNGAFFRRDPGIVPGLIQRFWDAREQARLAKDELARFAIKIHMNSMYGVLASPNCRFFNRRVGNAITGFAQHFIKMTAQKLRGQGYEVIYGDTDSIFIDIKTKDYEEAQRIGKHIQDSMNTFLKEHIKEEYALPSYLELEFEKTYIKFVMPTVRGSDQGAKKRYAGLIRKADGTEDISFTGLEMVRRDWTELAKDFQYTLYKKIFAEEEVAQYVGQYIKDLKEGKFDDKLVYKKALRKEVSEYTKTTPPHVKAAMKLTSELDSNIISYVLTINGPEPVQNLTSSIDYDHYIDKQLKPIADSILSLYGTSFEDVIKGSSQSSLFDY